MKEGVESIASLLGNIPRVVDEGAKRYAAMCKKHLGFNYERPSHLEGCPCYMCSGGGLEPSEKSKRGKKGKVVTDE